jgi:hypothetical protein
MGHTLEERTAALDKFLSTHHAEDPKVPEAVTATCSDKVIFADFDKSAEFITGETVPVDLLPKDHAEFTFVCPMGIFRGKLIVE